MAPFKNLGVLVVLEQTFEATYIGRKECRVLDEIVVTFGEELVQLCDVPLIPRGVVRTPIEVPWG